MAYRQNPRCPNCSSNHLSWKGQEAGWCSLVCDKCKSTWTESYTLTAIEYYEPTELETLTPEMKPQIELEKAKAEIALLKNTTLGE